MRNGESGRFTRKRENFECNQCGLFVIGNGYTNHCPRCLWSMHVDVNPGDRASACRGPMEPVEAVYEIAGFVIKHRCTECGAEKKISSSENDNADLLLEITGAGALLS